MKRSTLIATIAVDLEKRGVAVVCPGCKVNCTEVLKKIANAVDEWLDGHKWAGQIFDDNAWNRIRFALDVRKVMAQRQGVSQ